MTWSTSLTAPTAQHVLQSGGLGFSRGFGGSQPVREAYGAALNVRHRGLGHRGTALSVRRLGLCQWHTGQRSVVGVRASLPQGSASASGLRASLARALMTVVGAARSWSRPPRPPLRPLPHDHTAQRPTLGRVPHWHSAPRPSLGPCRAAPLVVRYSFSGGCDFRQAIPRRQSSHARSDEAPAF